MGRVIDADAFDKRIRLDVGSCEEELTEDFKDGISTILEMMKTAPTVDTVPVVRSGWIPKEKADTPYGLEMECAKCGFSVIVNDALYFKFCPNCGARMDGKDGEGRE